MNTTNRNSILAGVSFTLAAIVATHAVARASTASNMPMHSCAAFVDDSIPVGQSRVEVLVKFSEPIGSNTDAAFPTASKVDVLGIKNGDEPNSLRLVLNTATAERGQWKLSVSGDLDTCTGLVYVGKRIK